uniref:Mha2 n=1 Tax=Arundo donax TaxID=35708 RepID=A0A0A9DAM2_ARUDO
MVSALSCLGGSNRGNKPTNCHGPPGESFDFSGTSCLATASERRPRSAYLSIIACTFLFISSLQLHRVRICSGAPLLTRCQLPSASMYVRAVLLSTGLKGKKCTSLIPALASLGSASIPTMAASMASWFSVLEALAAHSNTWSLSTPFANTSTRFLSTLSLLRVSVPVLSLQSTSMPAISSMAVILLVMAPCCDSLWEPMAMVTDSTVGMAIGIPPIRRTSRFSIPARYLRCWIGNMTMISMMMPTAMEQIQKFPIAVRTFWKWPTWLVLSTRCAALPKKVCTPVAMTTASISPCLHVEPEKTSSPGPLVTGRDSPVSAD